MITPGVAFALRFGNEDGFVQQFFAKQRDLVARELRDTARCLLVFKELGTNPVYSPHWAAEAQADFYDFSPENRERIKRFVYKNRIVVVVFQGANIGEIDLKFLHSLGVRTISTEDNSFDHTRTQSFIRAAAKFMLRKIFKLQIHDLHIANTRAQYDFLRHFVYLPAQRLRLIPYGIDTDYYSPGDRRAACSQLRLDPGTIWIMAAAQSRPEKRVDLLIDAVRRVKEARPLRRIGFFYVGDGWMLAQWKELARNLLPATDYRFFGKQSDLRPFYHAASIFIHGSIRESFGLVLAEAMASGLPVIATRAHGPAEIIHQGNTGYLVGRDDWDAFIGAILSYIDRPELGRSHGEMGRRRCLERYTSDREASELAGLIRPFLGQASRDW
jgi:glycosyltransferase involved in cell wall biosynthesis